MRNLESQWFNTKRVHLLFMSQCSRHDSAHTPVMRSFRHPRASHLVAQLCSKSIENSCCSWKTGKRPWEVSLLGHNDFKGPHIPSAPMSAGLRSLAIPYCKEDQEMESSFRLRRKRKWDLLNSIISCRTIKNPVHFQ